MASRLGKCTSDLTDISLTFHWQQHAPSSSKQLIKVHVALFSTGFVMVYFLFNIYFIEVTYFLCEEALIPSGAEFILSEVIVLSKLVLLFAHLLYTQNAVFFLI